MSNTELIQELAHVMKSAHFNAIDAEYQTFIIRDKQWDCALSSLKSSVQKLIQCALFRLVRNVRTLYPSTYPGDAAAKIYIGHDDALFQFIHSLEHIKSEDAVQAARVLLEVMSPVTTPRRASKNIIRSSNALKAYWDTSTSSLKRRRMVVFGAITLATNNKHAALVFTKGRVLPNIHRPNRVKLSALKDALNLINDTPIKNALNNADACVLRPALKSKSESLRRFARSTRYGPFNHISEGLVRTYLKNKLPETSKSVVKAHGAHIFLETKIHKIQRLHKELQQKAPRK
jgi:hypothetical protein